MLLWRLLAVETSNIDIVQRKVLCICWLLTIPHPHPHPFSVTDHQQTQQTYNNVARIYDCAKIQRSWSANGAPTYNGENVHQFAFVV